jgi:cell division septation protein DedD
MERRNHERFAVSLKAALLRDQAMPVGCRVRDVSKSGMLLQYEHQDPTRLFNEGDSVEVRLSLKQGEGRKVIPLPMTVRRVEENGIGAEFLHPQWNLMKLLEPYRLDREETQRAVASQGGGTVKVGNTTGLLSPDASARASRRRFAIQRARAQISEAMGMARGPVGEDNKTEAVDEQAPEARSVSGVDNRRLFYVGLAALVAAVAVLLLDFGQQAQTENRLSALESAVERQSDALGTLRARPAPADISAGHLAQLDARVEQLTASFAALETRIEQGSGQATIPAAAPANTAATPTSAPLSETAGPASATSTETTTPAAPQVAGDGGRWVINLVSLYDENAATRFAEKAQSKGVRADVIRVAVKDRQVWRVQVGGFPSREAAGTYAESNKAKLGLDSVWVFKK